MLCIELATPYPNKKTCFEMIKLTFCGTSIQYATLGKKSQNDKLRVLQRKLKITENQLPNLPASMYHSQEAAIQGLQCKHKK